MSKRKPTPRFTIGQVVFVKAEKTFLKVGSMNLQGHWYYWPEDSRSIGWGKRELRPLSAREIGRSKRNGEQ